MPVIDRRGQPLPKDHPFSGTQIIFGGKRSGLSENPSETLKKSSAQPDPMQQAVDGIREAMLKQREELLNMGEHQSRLKPWDDLGVQVREGRLK